MEPELTQALAEWRQGALRTYYDRDADQRDRDTYYASIADQVAPDVLFAKVHQLLRSTHENFLQILPFRILYPWIDLHPDRQLHCLYSQNPCAPEDAMKRDSEASVQRRRRLMELHLRDELVSPGAGAGDWELGLVGSHEDAHQYQAELDAISQSWAFHCDEVVPRGWYGGAEPMRSDLHHLFMTEPQSRLFRQGTPFRDLTGAGRASCECGQAGLRTSRGFEPLKSKGVIARAALYFLVRYPGALLTAFDVVLAETLEALLHWHEQEPVSLYELHRNQSIFQVQGNRNPFIDFPNWAARVDFRCGLNALVRDDALRIDADADTLRAG